MTFKEHDLVRLKHKPDWTTVQAGSVGTVIHAYGHGVGGRAAYEVEFDGEDGSKSVLTLEGEDLLEEVFP